MGGVALQIPKEPFSTHLVTFEKRAMKTLTYTVIVCYSFSNEWLGMTRLQRKAFENAHVLPILGSYREVVRIRSYDSEAFMTEFTDFMVIETEDLRQYYFMIEELRDSPLFVQGLATIKQIFIGLEDGYKEFEEDINQSEEVQNAIAV